MTVQSPVSRAAARIWPVGALCHAVADALEARFNPVAVRGELSGFSRAASGHCYFTLKDAQGQLRCAMFRRAASLLDFEPRDGDQVELRGRLGVYEPRGELQLVVESLRRAGQGTLFEQFLERKARLEAEGLFDPARKRPLPVMPGRIGIVTSLGAAALHDVMHALRRRAPHVEVVVAPASVQGVDAPAELVRALQALCEASPPPQLILLVRGGGSIEDLWAFNDETLARAIARSPVPIVSGVGHETDFTLADFCADLRAPTPTAAAELAVAPRESWLAALDLLAQRLVDTFESRLNVSGQYLDRLAARLGRPSTRVSAQHLHGMHLAQRLNFAGQKNGDARRRQLQTLTQRWAVLPARALERQHDRLDSLAARLQLLDPARTLQRGYAWLSDAQGHTVTRVDQLAVGEAVRAQLADGEAELVVEAVNKRPLTRAD